ncbi:hypothetical protein GMORB2_3172 [Geosmithia morbida]|uniref:Uncharacterized protein n=1 Tax=Geosmithia morbida TaxID=1094350 RepID=A0A9P4YRN2_9HYPO|nr:uncharacterized protein GMORB2_3172 [Geosmithia morbida]KAF4120371.1 hypothetical protein GMORB2_3172 [Geosmithia morbida]
MTPYTSGAAGAVTRGRLKALYSPPGSAANPDLDRCVCRSGLCDPRADGPGDAPLLPVLRCGDSNRGRLMASYTPSGPYERLDLER